MSARISVAVFALLLSTAVRTSAQSPPPYASSQPVAPEPTADWICPIDEPTPADQAGPAVSARPARNPFTSIGPDLKTFFTSRETAVLLGVFAPAAGVAYTLDDAAIRESQEHLHRSTFQPGNIGGGFLVQTSVAVGAWATGTLAGDRKTAEVGGDLIRAQITSQVLVQGVKFVTRRERPDESNSQSFPSGHTASAFATATVLERHFGWKIGVPAYGFATYVGLARMSANKHHMSDVIMGAAIGLASARAVTVGVGGAKFSVGMVPTQGGAAVMFTRQ